MIGFWSAGAMGGGVVPVDGVNYLIENGSNKPFYSSATFPAALHDSATNRTWIAYEGWGTGRIAVVTYYDHGANEYGPTVSAGEIPLVNDSHGMPAVCIDGDGYVHVFFGPHGGDMRYSVSASPGDNTAWTAKSNIGGLYTYPNPVCIGTTIYLFMRKSIPAGAAPWVLRRITGLSGGSGTVAAEVVIADPQGTDRFYVGPCYAVGTEIHMVGTISNSANSDRSDIYYLIYDTTNGSVKNHDGTTVITSGSLPVDRTELDADFMIAATATTGTQAGFCFDSGGNAHVAWLDGSGSSFNVYHMLKSGGSWSTPEIVTTTDNAEVPLALVNMGGSAVDLWLPVDPTNAWAIGGDMARASRPAGGPWSGVSVVLAATDRALFHATPVVNGVSGARVMFDEIAQTDNNGDAGNKIYLRSSSGYVQRGIQGAATQAILDAFSTPASDARAATIDRLVFDLEQLGIWGKLDGLWMLAAATSDAALVNWINPGTHDLTLVNSPTFTADSYYETNGTNSYLDTNFNPATAGGNYTQNSASFGIFSATSTMVTASSAGWYDGTDGTTLRPMGTVTNTFATRINSAGSYDSGTVPVATGLFLANRSGASAVQNYIAGRSVGTSTVASTAVNSANFRLGSITATGFAQLRFRAAVVGGSLTATEVRQLNDALMAYLQGVGAV